MISKESSSSRQFTMLLQADIATLSFLVVIQFKAIIKAKTKINKIESPDKNIFFFKNY